MEPSGLIISQHHFKAYYDTKKLEQELDKLDEECSDSQELGKVFGSSETINQLETQDFYPFTMLDLEKTIPTLRDVNRLRTGTLTNQIKLICHNLFIVKYSLIFPSSTLKKFKPQLHLNGRLDSKEKISRKTTFVWNDFLMVTKFFSDKFTIEDARYRNVIIREDSEIPNLNQVLPPVFQMDQFEELGEFLKTQQFAARIHDKFKGPHSLFNWKIQISDDKENKKSKHIYVLLGHATKETAEAYILNQKK